MVSTSLYAATAAVLALAAGVVSASELNSEFVGGVCAPGGQAVLAVDDQWFLAGSGANGPPVSSANAPNAFDAALQFTSALSPSATNSFESVTGSTLEFAGIGPATFSPTSSSGLSAIVSTQSNGFRPSSGSKFYGINNGNGVTIDFSTPQQAVGFFVIDALEKQDVVVTCVNGETQTYTLEGTNCPDLVSGCNPIAYFATVADAADPSSWCTSISVVSQGSGDSFGIDDLTVGSCEPLLPTADAACDCESACVSSGDALSATLTFSEGAAGPCPAC